MKNIVLTIGLLLSITSCVQKTYQRKVVFNLDVKGIKNVYKVGIRGENKPLNWNQDLELKIGKDSIYSTTITFETGYKFAQFKFVVNDNFELQEKDNRRIYFVENGTTIVNARFNVLK